MKLVVIGVAAVVLLAFAVAMSGGGVVPGLGGPDGQIRTGAETIARACSDYAGHYGYGPSRDEVGPDGGVAQFVDTWPTNPLTGGPMLPGAGPGGFQYHAAILMPDKSYTGYVYGYLTSGEAYPVEFRY